MSRHKKYVPPRGIFKPLSTKPEPPPAIIGNFCPECRKRIPNHKIKAGQVYCSRKCSNRAKGRKQIGVKRKHFNRLVECGLKGLRMAEKASDNWLNVGEAGLPEGEGNEKF